MIIDVMTFLFVLLFSLTVFSNEPSLIIEKKFFEIDLYQEGVTYNVVSFTFEQELPSSNYYDDDIIEEQNVKLGIVSTDNVLVDIIWEYQSLSGNTKDNIIDSIELNDLNNDKFTDIIVNYHDVDSDFPDQIITSFLLNNNNKFQEISETFVKNRYEIIENAHVKYASPLALFGRPYVDEDSQKDDTFWVDHYEFQGLKLINVNQKYCNFYETLKIESLKNLEQTLDKIKRYSMTEELNINQLQLEEYNEVTELKIIIYEAIKYYTNSFNALFNRTILNGF